MVVALPLFSPNLPRFHTTLAFFPNIGTVLDSSACSAQPNRSAFAGMSTFQWNGSACWESLSQINVSQNGLKSRNTMRIKHFTDHYLCRIYLITTNNLIWCWVRVDVFKNTINFKNLYFFQRSFACVLLTRSEKELKECAGFYRPMLVHCSPDPESPGGSIWGIGVGLRPRRRQMFRKRQQSPATCRVRRRWRSSGGQRSTFQLYPSVFYFCFVFNVFLNFIFTAAAWH